MIHLKCIECGQYMVVDPSLAGRSEECLNCGKVNVIASVSDSAAAPEELPLADEPPSHAGAPQPAAPPDADKNARMWAMLCHLGGLGWFVFPTFGGIIAPLVLWLLKKDDHPFIDASGKEALNFQLTVLIAFVICIPLVFVFVGVLLLPAVSICNVIFVVLASVKTNEGQRYRYPFAIRFIK